MERQAEHRGWGWLEVVEELVLKAVKDADEEVFALDRLALSIVKGDDHGGLVLIGWLVARAVVFLDLAFGISAFPFSRTFVEAQFGAGF